MPPDNIADVLRDPPFIVAFYDEAMNMQDYRDRSIMIILGKSNYELEHQHDYIQILFPLPEKSPVNPRAPVIDRQVRDAFYWHWHLRDRLRESLNRMLAFYGFDELVVHLLTPDSKGRRRSISYDINPLPDKNRFKNRANATWRTPMDHNHLRITRILRCLRVLGEDGAARAFLAALRKHDPEEIVSRRSIMYWERAMNRPLHLPPDEEDEDAAGIAWLKEPVGFKIRCRNEEICTTCGEDMDNACNCP